MFKAFGAVFGGILAAAVAAGEREDWDWQYYEQRQCSDRPPGICSSSGNRFIIHTYS